MPNDSIWPKQGFKIRRNIIRVYIHVNVYFKAICLLHIFLYCKTPNFLNYFLSMLKNSSNLYRKRHQVALKNEDELPFLKSSQDCSILWFYIACENLWHQLLFYIGVNLENWTINTNTKPTTRLFLNFLQVKILKVRYRFAL